MARNIHNDLKTATESKVVYPIALLFLDFPSGAVRLWTGYGDLVWDGFTWQGTGELGEISVMEEALEVAAKGATLRLNGIPADIGALSLLDQYQGRAAVLYLAALTAAGTLVANPYAMLSARMDQIEKEDQGESCALILTVENRLVDLERNRERMLTHQEQQVDYPGDLGFEFVNFIQNRPLLWGNSAGLPASGTPEPPREGEEP